MVSGDMQGFPKRNEIIAYIVAIIPLFINFASYTSVNGRVTSYRDLADVVWGGILLFLVFINRVYITGGEPKYKLIRIILAVVLALVAIFHIASGLGLLISLPPPLGFG